MFAISVAGMFFHRFFKTISGDEIEKLLKDAIVGSGKPIHFRGIHGGPDTRRNPGQHGWPRTLSRQREDGTFLVGSQIRGHQTQGLRKFECPAARCPELREFL